MKRSMEKLQTSVRGRGRTGKSGFLFCLGAAALALVLFRAAQANTATGVTYEQATDGRVQEAAPSVIRPPKVAIGTRYKIEGWIVATKTFDGRGDNMVEVKGGASFSNTLKDGPKNVTLCDLKTPQSMSAGQKIKFGPVYADQTVFNPNSDNYGVGGSFYDVDSDGSLTTLFVGNNLGGLSSDSKKGEITLFGKRDNANIDIVYTITAVKTLYS